MTKLGLRANLRLGLGANGKGVQTPPPAQTLRVTEGGEDRLTESGEQRVTEDG